MKVQVNANRSLLWHTLLLSVFLFLGMFCATTFGHEWTVDGREVKAKAVDFNGSHVLLEDEFKNRKRVAINDLNARDMEYLSNMVSMRNSELQRKLQSEQLEQQRLQLLSQFTDLWAVSMVAPNGESAWRTYFAANSLLAEQQALREFPNVRVVGVQRIRRNDGLGIGGGGVGVMPVPIFNGIFFRH